jgi:hypothetical protein
MSKKISLRYILQNFETIKQDKCEYLNNGQRLSLPRYYIKKLEDEFGVLLDFTHEQHKREQAQIELYLGIKDGDLDNLTPAETKTYYGTLTENRLNSAKNKLARERQKKARRF